MFRLTIFILLFGSSMAQQCTKTCTNTYKDRKDLQTVGCNQTTMWTTSSRSKLSCAASCAANKTCAAFSYQSKLGTCSLCHGDLIDSLNFTSGQDFYWPQKYQEKWPLTDSVNNHTSRTLSGTITVTTGTVIHLYGYYYSYSGFYIDLMQDSSGDNIIFHFRARRNLNSYYTIGIPILNLSNRKNGIWGAETVPRYAPYPFAENTVTTVDILVAKDGYKIYIDQQFWCSYNHVMPFENIQYLRITGNIQVYRGYEFKRGDIASSLQKANSGDITATWVTLCISPPV